MSAERAATIAAGALRMVHEARDALARTEPTPARWRARQALDTAAAFLAEAVEQMGGEPGEPGRLPLCSRYTAGEGRHRVNASSCPAAPNVPCSPEADT